MKFLHNEMEYRNWIMEDIFQASAVGENETSIFADQEIDDFIFDARPVAYPCIAVMIQTPGQPGVCEPRFVYKEQVFEWAHQMGLVSIVKRLFRITFCSQKKQSHFKNGIFSMLSFILVH